MVYIIKADGSKQIFERWKVVRTCLRFGLKEEEANKVADKVESKIYEGITTKEILKLIFRFVKEFKPEIRHQIDLRESISLLRSKPDFEFFVDRLLKEEGYEVERNVVLRGKCVEHEIDCIARKGNEVIYVEVKHHVNPHTFTGLDVFLKSYAAFLDLNEGYRFGINKTKFDKILIVCSTKISEHALEYANCMKISYIAWKVPKERSLERIISERKLYPITLIKNLGAREQSRLIANGFILLKDLIKFPTRVISKKTGIDKKRVEELKDISKKLLKS